MAGARFLSPPACVIARGSRAPVRPGVLDTGVRVILFTARDTTCTRTRSHVYFHIV